MTTFPNSPRLQKGAIVGLDPANPAASVIVFQYNPDTLTRTLTPQTTGGDPDKGEMMRFKGPPQETISLTIEIDAADQLEQGKKAAATMGIYPALSALEVLLYPKSNKIIANEVLQKLGIVEIIQQEAPLTLFAWGMKRVLPVRFTGFTITEEAFDENLNPVRANVKLDMRVLSYQDIGYSSYGGALFMAHQIAKETMASINGGNTITGPLNTFLK